LKKLSAVILAAGVAFFAGCASFSVNMPAVTDEPSEVRLPGKIIWHDLLTDTPEASKRFYSELFGWEFQEIGLDLGIFRSVNYTLIRHNGELIGGMIDQSRLDTQADISQWVVLVSVSDIEKATEALEAGGGKVFTPPTDLAERGRIAVVADAQGALFAMLETKDGDPIDKEPAIGSFLWDEIWSANVDETARFYQRIADYEIGEKSVNANEGYRFLSTEGKPRAGILANPVEELPPLWVTYIRVDDPAAITARVEELGGQILLDSQDRDLGGQVALIAGPSGAGIALQSWSPPEI
jgi:predicted enzyme related to lactoylglutathione lyase